MHTYDVAGYHIRGLLHGLRALRLDVEQLLRDCSIDRATLDDTEVRFSDMQVGMLWLFAQQRYGKATFGFDVATRIPLGKLELIDYLVAACPTVGAGFECLMHHARLCASGVTYRVDDVTHDGEPGKRLVADHHHPISALPFSMSEYVWTSLIVRFRQVCGPAFRPVLWLRERSAVSPAELLAALGRVPLVAPEEALFVPSSQWELENPRRDPMLHQLLAAHARDVASRLPESTFLSVVQAAIVSCMHHGDPGIGRVALRLGLTPRTLQRRLEGDGVVFQEVLEELRQELALRYLAGTRMSLTDISALLAYADSSAFGRAFRRWTGRTPAAFRQEQQLPLMAVGEAGLPGRADRPRLRSAAADPVLRSRASGPRASTAKPG